MTDALTKTEAELPPEKSDLALALTDIGRSLIAIAAIGFAHLVSGVFSLDLWFGLALIAAIVAVGYLVAHFVPVRSLPDLFWISLVTMVAAWPGVPGSGWVRETIDAVNFLPTITPLMAFAALGLSRREVSLFKEAGLKFIVIALLVFAGTFLGSAIIANFVLGWT
ncbi:MAG: hypothetical protein AAF127_07435 [Pseudomonadota bacterium]